MIREFTKGRVAIFIDAANIFYSQRTFISPEHQEQGEVIEKEKIKGPDKPALEV